MDNFPFIGAIITLLNGGMIVFAVKRYGIKIKHSETERETNFKEVNFIIDLLKDERDRLTEEMKVKDDECKASKEKLRLRIKELENKIVKAGQ